VLFSRAGFESVKIILLLASNIVITPASWFEVKESDNTTVIPLDSYKFTEGNTGVTEIAGVIATIFTLVMFAEIDIFEVSVEINWTGRVIGLLLISNPLLAGVVARVYLLSPWTLYKNVDPL